MPSRPGKTMIGAYLDDDLAEAFRAIARRTRGGVSAMIRKFVEQTVETGKPREPVGRVAEARGIDLNLREPERSLLREQAERAGMPVATYVRVWLGAHLLGRPGWREEDGTTLRDIFYDVRKAGVNLNQIARALNVAVKKGEYPPSQIAEVRELVQMLRAETRRVAAVYSGNIDRWGVPTEDWPTPPPGAAARLAQAEEQARAADTQARSRQKDTRRARQTIV